MSDVREKLTFEQACELLAKGRRIHTFRNTGPILLGCDWSRKDVLDAIKKHGAELSGPQATAMDHGLALFDNAGVLFIATKPRKPQLASNTAR